MDVFQMYIPVTDVFLQGKAYIYMMMISLRRNQLQLISYIRVVSLHKLLNSECYYLFTTPAKPAIYFSTECYSDRTNQRVKRRTCIRVRQSPRNYVM